MTQFKIGSVYRNVGDDIVRLAPIEHPANKKKWGSEYHGHSFAWALRADDGFARGYVRLTDGVYVMALGETQQHPQSLVPGELHNFNGQWLPVEEERMAPYFAEALEEKPAERVRYEFPRYVQFVIRDPNAAMLARDAANYVARPAAPVVIQEPAKTSHSPIAGLTVLENRDHRFGSFRF